ncbi:hypothetical protein BDF19DRAFT_265977 [Syncephalis fuscata]|nr:hypothetical protein BDF19DRAFT_265977 [Syncephalis fuscata]
MLFTGSFILSVASGYYLYGFHCLAHECAHQLSDNKIMSTMMQTAARNLRNLFFGLFIGFSGLIVFSTIIGTISAYILNVRLQVIDILIQEVFIYPIIHIAMLIIILKSSMNQVRYKKALIEKNTSKENSIKASNSCNLCDANNNGASTVMSLPVHLDDITLIWQSFIRPCPAVESPSMYHNIV